jgi:hypothetical protein
MRAVEFAGVGRGGEWLGDIGVLDVLVGIALGAIWRRRWVDALRW